MHTTNNVSVDNLFFFSHYVIVNLTHWTCTQTQRLSLPHFFQQFLALVNFFCQQMKLTLFTCFLEMCDAFNFKRITNDTVNSRLHLNLHFLFFFKRHTKIVPADYILSKYFVKNKKTQTKKEIHWWKCFFFVCLRCAHQCKAHRQLLRQSWAVLPSGDFKSGEGKKLRIITTSQFMSRSKGLLTNKTSA